MQQKRKSYLVNKVDINQDGTMSISLCWLDVDRVVGIQSSNFGDRRYGRIYFESSIWFILRDDIDGLLSVWRGLCDDVDMKGIDDDEKC